MRDVLYSPEKPLSRTARTLLSERACFASAFRPTRADPDKLYIIRTENQFVTYRVDVKDRLVKGTNELVITFPSTYLKVPACLRLELSRAFVR
jgi:hypothetical protein